MIRNEARIPVSNLSSDILITIFSLLRDTHSSSMDLMQDYSSVLWDWLTVTVVCRHWRHVALECPGLWSDIFSFYGVNKIRVFLRRSGESEIRVNLRLGFPYGDAIVALFHGHMWRVRVFKITITWKGWDNVMARLDEMTERAKVVELNDERLLVRLPPHVGANATMINKMPDKLLGVKLDSLSLKSVALPWSCPLYHGLTRLSIAIGTNLVVQPSIEQLKEILVHCPDLRHLSLRGISPFSTSAEISIAERQYPKVRLLSLKTIVLSDVDFSLWSYLFTIVEVEERIQLDVSFFGYPFFAPLPLSTKVLDRRKECSSIHIRINSANLVIQSNAPFNSDSSSFDTSVSVALPPIPSSRRIMTAIGKLLSHPSWKTAHEVSISFNAVRHYRGTEMEKYSWGVLLDGLPEITRKLSIRFTSDAEQGHFDFNGLPEALSKLISNMFTQDIRLPVLEELLIYNADFQSRDGKDIYNYFVEYMCERSVHARRKVKVYFLDCYSLERGQWEF